jgi:hypothetical protein
MKISPLQKSISKSLARLESALKDADRRGEKFIFVRALDKSPKRENSVLTFFKKTLNLFSL